MESRIYVALAEDHNLVREMLIDDINSSLDITVVADAANGKELMDKLDNLNKIPAVCILDISMPILNGYDTLTLLRKRYPTMKFLILTMFENEYSIISMIKNGANGYVLKGECGIGGLLDAIRHVSKYDYYYSKSASEEAFNIVKKIGYTLLSKKEQQFLQFCCSQLTYQDIAKMMCVSVKTIERYQAVISDKLNIRNRTSLALFAIQSGLVSIKKN